MIEAVDRLRLLQDVIVVLSEAGVNIVSTSSMSHKDGFAEMRFTFELTDAARIPDILRSVRAVEGVFGAERVIAGSTSRKKKRGKGSAPAEG